MIKNQKRTTSAENDYVLTNVTYTTPTVSTTPTNKTNKDLILTIQKRNFWKEEAQTDKPTATIKIPLSDYVLRTYLEENYYNKTAIDGFIEQYKIKVVVLESKNNLPQSGDSRYADTSYLFLVRHTHTIDSSSQGDYFDEYIWNNDKSDYERIGNTDIDLSPYLKIADFNAWKNNTYTPTITAIQNDITSLQTDKENVSNKVTSISDSSTDTQYPSAKLLNTELKKKEDTSNKVTSVNDSSTDTQYPSAKLLNTELKKKEDTSNKVTSINDLSTDTQYPSAKLLNTELKTKEDISNKATVISASSTDNEYPTAKAVHSIASTKLDKSDAFSKNYNDLTNKPTIPTKTSDLINDSDFITEHQDISGKEDKSNKVTSISPDSTDTQYPSAKCVYDLIGNISGDAPGITPFSHTHGNITNEGAIGSTANKPLITGTNGVIQTGSFGIDDNTFCEGSDLRLSDSRNPKFININASSTSPKDLDDYTTGGFYFCGENVKAPYIRSCPKTGSDNKAFYLLVETWGNDTSYAKQTLTYYDYGKTYIRTKMPSSWTPWVLIPTTINYISSTHTSSTSAWTGTSDEIVKITRGTIIYYYLKQEPTTYPVTLDLTLTDGNPTGAKNVYFDGSTRLSNQYKKYSMLCLYWTGTDWFVLNPYNDSIYIKNVDGAVLNANIGNNQVNNAKLSDNSVSTSKIQDRAVTNAKIETITDNKLTYDSTVYNGLSPIDMSMVDASNANRLAFMPAANIQVKVSTNGGNTWSDYPSITNDMKLRMVSKAPDETNNLYSGGTTTASANNQIRVILDAGEITSSKNSDVYCSIAKKLMIAFTANNASIPKVTIDMASYANPTTWVNAQTYNVGGWWGWNSIPFPYIFGGYQGQQNLSDHYRYIRLTFTHTGGSGNPIVKAIRLYTPISYISPSNYAKYGHIYSYDTNQNVTFPAKIIKDGGKSSEFLKANGDVETLNTTPCTVTYTDGTTSTINFVTR